MVARGDGSEISIDGRFAQVYVFENGLVVAVESYDTIADALRSAGLSAP